MKSLVWVGVCVCFVAGAWLSSSRSIAQPASDVPLRAIYETRVQLARAKVLTRRWAFGRADSVVEYHDFTDDVTERWRQDARANVSFLRIFHREHTAVRYVPGDLAALGVATDWFQLTHVVAPPSPNHFKAAAMAEVLGHRARVFRAVRGASRVEMSWIAELGIPGFVRVRAPGRAISAELIELSATPPQLANLPKRQLDVTDFGDMEHDAFVRRHHADLLPGTGSLSAVLASAMSLRE